MKYILEFVKIVKGGFLCKRCRFAHEGDSGIVVAGAGFHIEPQRFGNVLHRIRRDLHAGFLVDQFVPFDNGIVERFVRGGIKPGNDILAEICRLRFIGGYAKVEGFFVVGKGVLREIIAHLGVRA